MSPTSLINLNVDRLSDVEGAPYGARLNELVADLLAKRQALRAVSDRVAATQAEMIQKEIDEANALDAAVEARCAFDNSRRSAK